MDFIWHMNHWNTYVYAILYESFVFIKENFKKNIQPVVVIKTVFITFLYGKIPRNSYKLYMYNFKSFFRFCNDDMIFSKETQWYLFTLKTNDKSFLRVHVWN